MFYTWFADHFFVSYSMWLASLWICQFWSRINQISLVCTGWEKECFLSVFKRFECYETGDWCPWCDWDKYMPIVDCFCFSTRKKHQQFHCGNVVIDFVVMVRETKIFHKIFTRLSNYPYFIYYCCIRLIVASNERKQFNRIGFIVFVVG